MGSSVVTGFGAPDEAAGCIQICENGRDNQNDYCDPDDIVLGSGGTDGNGAFAITLDNGYTLAAGAVICVYDGCLPLAPPPDDPNAYRRGNCRAIVDPSRAPALSPSGTLLSVVAVSLVGLAGLLRRRRA